MYEKFEVLQKYWHPWNVYNVIWYWFWAFKPSVHVYFDAKKKDLWPRSMWVTQIHKKLPFFIKALPIANTKKGRTRIFHSDGTHTNLVHKLKCSKLYYCLNGYQIYQSYKSLKTVAIHQIWRNSKQFFFSKFMNHVLCTQF